MIKSNKYIGKTFLRSNKFKINAMQPVSDSSNPIDNIQPGNDNSGQEMTGEGLRRKPTRKNEKLRKFISLKIK